MLSNNQLVSLITALGFSAGSPEDRPGVDPIWPKINRRDQGNMITNFAINALIDMTEASEPSFGSIRGPGVKSAFPAFGMMNDRMYQYVMNYLNTRKRKAMHDYAETVESELARLRDQINISGLPDSGIIQPGNSRYYPLDVDLANSLRKDLAGRFPFVEFTSKVGGMVSVHLLSRGQELPDVWDDVMQFVIYLMRSYKDGVKVGNAPTPNSEPANAISKQARNLIAKVPVDERYEAIHKFGNKFVKELELRGL